MSRGPGHVERTILQALQTTKRPYAALYELVVLVEGRINTLDEPWQHWLWTTCEPHPPIRNAIGRLVDHRASCYPPRPSRSVQEATSRAVRSLVRKGMVRCEYEGDRPKRLPVYLPSTDSDQLPKAQRRLTAIRYELATGRPYPGRRRIM